MENVEFRSGPERFPEQEPRLNPGFLDQGHPPQPPPPPLLAMIAAGEQRGADPYKLVEVQLTGGAPWGFTLKGGREHGEPLIITKIEEGSKAAVVDKLLAGDEIVGINDVSLSGFRQEAICLVKGSHKTLKLVVKRKNDLACRPHSWHATKFTDNQPDTATSRLASTNACASWHSRYHASSSSHDLSSSWDQSNLYRTSDQFSSAGSMDSWDHIPQTYPYGQISSAKSNSSIDHLGNPNKRDSAYGSFSTSSSTPDHTLSASTENVVYKVGHWETPKQGSNKGPSYLSDNGRLEEKASSLPPPPQYENNRSPRLEDPSDSMYSGSGRSNFVPVWYIPEKKKSPSPPPPPPPLRSDSFAATKGHERALAPFYSEGVQNTQHFEVLPRPPARSDWAAETSEQLKQVGKASERVSDGRKGGDPPYRLDFNMDSSLTSACDRVSNNMGNVNRLHSSLSSTDIRFAQSAYGQHCHHHQRQYSDESTFFHNAKVSASPKEQRHLAAYAGLQKKSTDKHSSPLIQTRTPDSAVIASAGTNPEGKIDGAGLSHYYCVTVKQPAQGSSRPLVLKDASWNPEEHENPAVTTTSQSPKHYLPQRPVESSLDACEKRGHYIMNKGEDVRSLSEDPRKVSQNKPFEESCSSYHEGEYGQECVPESDRKAVPKDFKWSQEENYKISPQKTPMLHSLAQEGKIQAAVATEMGINKQAGFDAHLSKNARRSDRFATTLRNEIQMRRAKLQKSKSTAALAGSNETEEDAENWKPDSAESCSSESSFTNVYKDNLKEAQARVLKATSFQRRDLERNSADGQPDWKANSHNSSALAFAPDNKETGLLEARQSRKLNSPGNSAYHVPRIGARKRFTAQQKLKSYSEPEKINEVGRSEDDYRPHGRPTISEEALGSFADRWKFFEETSKPAYQKSSPRHVPCSQLETPPSNALRNSQEGEPEGSWCERRMRSASFGVENILRTHNRPKESVRYSDHTSPKSEHYQRLETFAEYQASWKEQKKTLENRNSGRYHSADNILDAGHEQLEKSQYTHERSRSSPSTDHYKKKELTEGRRETENSRQNEEHISSALRTEERNYNLRPGDAQYPQGHPREPPAYQDYGLGDKWKASARPATAGQTTGASPGSRGRSGTLPSDYRYLQENVSERNDHSALPPAISELQAPEENHFCPTPGKGEDSQQGDPELLNRKHGLVPQRPPPPKRENNYRRQENTSASLAASSESLLTVPKRPVPSSLSSPAAQAAAVSPPASQTPAQIPGKLTSTKLPDFPQPAATEHVFQHLEGNTRLRSQPALSSTYHCHLKPGMERSRSPSPQFAPQKLTDKPPVAVRDENPTRIEKVMDNNTTVKMVPIKIVHSESHAEKESRQSLASTVEPPALPSGLEKDQIKTLSTSEHSRFCAYTRQGVEAEPESKARPPYLQPAGSPGTTVKESDVSGRTVSYVRAKEKTAEDWKSEELVREIVDKDKSLADILDPNVKIKTTMDLMVGIFPKDDHLLEEAQQRRKLLLKVPSPKAPENKKEEQPLPPAIPLTTSSTYYSTSAPKAELLIKMKDMQQEQQKEEDSEDELDHDLSEKKQELIDSISRKLQVLREARETMLEDIRANNLLGDDVEATVKDVCKPNEFDKFRMFIGDLDKVVNLLLSLSGRLARVENALNNLDENASPEERRILVDKQKLLTQQHEDAKELKENLDRRERIVFDILANYLSDESLADYEHFVKMKSALIIEQRELEDKIKLGEEQLKCLTESLQPERPK